MRNNQDTKDFKAVFASNLHRLMDREGKTVADISTDLDYPYMTVSDWVKGKKMPRMDKVQSLADYFNVAKSDLIEQSEKASTTEVVDAKKQELYNLIDRLPEEAYPKAYRILEEVFLSD